MKKVILVLFGLTVAAVCMAAVSSFYIVDDTTGDKIPFGTSGELHFQNISGVANDVTVFSSGGDISAHTSDSSIHFTESSIDHTHIQNIGTHTHAQLDSHVDDSSIHFTVGNIDHDALIGAAGYSSHSTIDAFLSDNAGVSAALSSHTSDSSIHAPIYDNVSTSTGTLWSSAFTKDYVDTEVAGAGGATIPTGTMWLYAGSTAPEGWSIADGEALDTTTEAALFAVIGYTYGGSGSTFYEPDMRGRTAIGAGQGSGLSNRTLGQAIGEESHVLSVTELPAHTHGANAGSGGTETFTMPVGSGNLNYTATGSTGDGMSHNTMQPSIVINYIIKY